ncbi:uncharacterized protein An08g02150 [Aspergillus niger]|uniref:Contig An08c0070, genomic contig n=2 Tax=Aspergillus niger TaxID=5061 RepID=A2QQD6_ASPNC|nr:uncharacterized protein An08g02150 [Aspergillus niger]CAK45261.1 unnamed protein product [Aspergillus niger]
MDRPGQDNQVRVCGPTASLMFIIGNVSEFASDQLFIEASSYLRQRN